MNNTYLTFYILTFIFILNYFIFSISKSQVICMGKLVLNYSWSVCLTSVDIVACLLLKFLIFFLWHSSLISHSSRSLNKHKLKQTFTSWCHTYLGTYDINQWHSLLTNCKNAMNSLVKEFWNNIHYKHLNIVT